MCPRVLTYRRERYPPYGTCFASFVGEVYARWGVFVVAWSCYRTLASRGYARTVAALAADGLVYLLAIMTNRAEEHPSLQAVEAVALVALPLYLLVCFLFRDGARLLIELPPPPHLWRP
jgi:hypothetical protein